MCVWFDYESQQLIACKARGITFWATRYYHVVMDTTRAGSRLPKILIKLASDNSAQLYLKNIILAQLLFAQDEGPRCRHEKH